MNLEDTTKDFFQHKILPGMLIATAIAVLFYPIFETYGYTDVYEFLYHARNDNFIHVFIQGGRPLYGLLNKFLLTSISTVEALAWLRLCGLSLTVFIFFRLLDESFNNKSIALLGSLFFLTSPSANIAGVWVGAYQVGWGLAMALLGGYAVIRALSMTTHYKQWLLIIIGCFLGLFALLTYQPSYTAFIIPGLLYFLKHLNIRLTLFFLAVYFSMYGVYYLAHNLILDLTALQPLARTGLTDDPVGKFFWFFKWPVKLVYEDNFIFYGETWRRWVALVFGAISVVSLFYLCRRRTYPTILLVVTGLYIFLFSCYVPNLLSSDNWVSYRTLSTLFMFKVVLILYGLNELQRRFRYLKFATAIFALLLMGNSWYNINYGFVSIQAKEFQLIRQEVNNLLPAMKEKGTLVFIMPDFEFIAKQGSVSRVVSDEFGSLSSSRDWVPMPIVKQVLREQNVTEIEKKLKVIKILNQEKDKAAEFTGAPILNVEELFSRSQKLK